jgi:hypothetical protein
MGVVPLLEILGGLQSRMLHKLPKLEKFRNVIDFVLVAKGRTAADGGF